MTDNEKVVEQIFSSVDRVGAILESTVDLKDDVYPFMTSTLAKIKELSLQSLDFQAQYELIQIANNYLPKAFDSYCGLPIAYRNKNLIKNDKTARNLLIEDLKIFKKEVSELEKRIFEKQTQQLQINSKIIQDKFSDKFQLAHEVQEMPNDGFVSEFDYDKYVVSPSYKDIVFKKKNSQPSPSQELITDITKKTSSIGKVLKEKSLSFFEFAASILPKVYNAFIHLKDYMLLSLLMAGVLGAFYMLFIAIDSSQHKNRYIITLSNSSQKIYNLMAVSLIPEKEFGNFVKSIEKDMLEKSKLVAQKVEIFQKDKIFTLKATDIRSYNCKEIIDNKELNFDGVKMSVNGIALPQDLLFSNHLAFENDNHKLCHLDENNTIVMEFNNQAIYDYAKNEKSNDSSVVAQKIKVYRNELVQAKEKLSKLNPKQNGFYETQSLVAKISERLNTLENVNK